MSKTLPLAMLIELAQNKTDDATRRLGQLQRAQVSAAEKLEMLIRYRQEYYDQLQSQMQDGVSSSRWRNFQHFIATLDGAIEQQRAVAKQADSRLAHGRSDWQQNKRRLSSFDTLAERVKQQQAQLFNKREQHASDEHAARQFRLRMIAAAE
ncbi:flagellar export protein FliJ [Collimonas silvisoli]|uniref:flagellar export protein FliJ n=1 Tax=Collimonas silvisoli TaxID=2825884 RepID=UPI001B8C3BCE|nr:flagellar export protein FliJ [Collimonas silvisoli]